VCGVIHWENDCFAGYDFSKTFGIIAQYLKRIVSDGTED